MEPWEENDSSNTMEMGNENISNSTIESGEGSASENSSIADLDISKIKGLKIASLNVNSLMKHIDEIRVMLINYPFDILAISETKIDSTISDSEIHIAKWVHNCQEARIVPKMEVESPFTLKILYPTLIGTI